jgi:hypothetical protein
MTVILDSIGIGANIVAIGALGKNFGEHRLCHGRDGYDEGSMPNRMGSGAEVGRKRGDERTTGGILP